MSCNDGSKVGMMDPAYFVGKRVLLQWMNELLSLNIKKIEETCSGAVACQVLHSIFPGKVPMSKVNFGAKYDYEYVKNYKVLQGCFTKLKISKVVPVDKLMRGKYQDNLEFMQWLRAFFDLNGGSSDNYNAVEARARSKNKPKSTIHSSESSSSSATAKPRSAPRTSAPKARIKETTKENARTGPTKKSPAAAATGPTSKLRAENEQLVHELSALKLEMASLQQKTAAADTGKDETEVNMALDGLEKERDFYFKKLRDIEVYLQEQGEVDEMEDGPTKEVVQRIFGVLYATDNAEFEAPPPTPEKEGLVAQSPSKLPAATVSSTIA